MVAIKKAYGYITNEIDGIKKVLVFEHPLAGVQIPKGTVEHDEEPAQAVTREMEEEGLIFRFFWVSEEDQIEIARGHDDYFFAIFQKEEMM